YRPARWFNPKLGRAYQSAAWLMATCPQPEYRNEQLAPETAQKAIALDGDKDYRYLETLAAAQASAGKFEDAQKTQRRVIQIAPKNDSAKYKARLELYKQGQPYREGADDPVSSTSSVMRRR